MTNARTRRAALLGTAACMLAAAPALAATRVASPHHAPAASQPAARHQAPASPQGDSAHGWIDSPPTSVAPGSPTGTAGATGAAAHRTGYAAGTIPTVPEQYARAALDAWVDGDHARLEELAAPSVVDLLTLRPWSAGDGWRDQTSCEGAAGSTYCTWTAASVQLTLRVGNELASQGAPHAVTEALFEPLAGRAVALWPYTTQEEADNSQQQVDEGHSPWQVEDGTVAFFYVEAELHWHNVDALSVADFVFRITDRDTGKQVYVTVDQPARQGPGGIWAVVALRSASGS